MHILISNDDGYKAKGIEVLRSVIADFAKVTVVAPDRNRSAASNSLTLRRPLYIHEQSPRIYYVEDGTPSDCVHLALSNLVDFPPDMVVSGINHGANLGDDVVYSGTVAAAMEGRHLGYPAIAFSIDGYADVHWDTAAKAIEMIIRRVMDNEIETDSILNVNIPNIPWDQVKGFKTTRLGRRHQSKPAIEVEDPRGAKMYWIGPVGDVVDEAGDTDFKAIEEGYISITPVSVDITRYSQLEHIQSWIPKIRDA